MTTTAPRAVFVTRETDYELLLARHATREQARFYLDTRGQKLAELETRHEQFQSVLRQARAAVPGDWRQTLVRRADLDRFLFAPEDVIVAVGQDGLVANVAKYLVGQPVLGVNPAPNLYDGVLVRVRLDRLGAALPASLHNDVEVEHRTMVEGVDIDRLIISAMASPRFISGTGECCGPTVGKVENTDLLVKHAGIVDMLRKSEPKVQAVVCDEPREDFSTKAKVFRRFDEG